jgi:hypothetical protein
MIGTLEHILSYFNEIAFKKDKYVLKEQHSFLCRSPGYVYGGTRQQ